MENISYWLEIDSNGIFIYKKFFTAQDGRELTVKTSDRLKVDSISYKFTDNDARIIIHNFFFKNDEFKRFNFSGEKGLICESFVPYCNKLNELPDDRPPMPKEYKKCFEDLGHQVKSLEGSLIKCISLIAPAGPKYNGKLL